MPSRQRPHRHSQPDILGVPPDNSLFRQNIPGSGDQNSWGRDRQTGLSVFVRALQAGMQGLLAAQELIGGAVKLVSVLFQQHEMRRLRYLHVSLVRT
jgi:hypothetical protein